MLVLRETVKADKSRILLFVMLDTLNIVAKIH